MLLSTKPIIGSSPIKPVKSQAFQTCKLLKSEKDNRLREAVVCESSIIACIFYNLLGTITMLLILLVNNICPESVGIIDLPLTMY